MRKGSVFASFLLLLAACDLTATVDPCRCEGAVPEGTLSVACGQTQCVGGTAGYLCLGDNAAVSAPEACATDAGVPAEADAGPIDLPDAGPPPPTFTTFLAEPSLGAVRGIWSAREGDTWFATESGQLLRWTGGATTNNWSFGVPLNAVHGSSATDVWVVGDEGMVARFDGASSFDPISDRPTYGPLLDTWGDAERRFIAGELYGDLKLATEPYFDAFVTHEVGDSSAGFLSGDTNCVSATTSALWVGGEDGLYGFDGSWHRILSSDRAPIRVLPVSDALALVLERDSLWLVTPREVALSGAFGPHGLPIPPGVEEWDGPRLRGMWGDLTEVWVVGTGGYVARLADYTNPFANWERIDVGTTVDLSSITADSGSIWIGGDSIILRRDR